VIVDRIVKMRRKVFEPGASSFAVMLQVNEEAPLG
jgi:hypothetical protein